jgi:Fe2+ transport system protein FeoA
MTCYIVTSEAGGDPRCNENYSHLDLSHDFEWPARMPGPISHFRPPPPKAAMFDDAPHPATLDRLRRGDQALVASVHVTDSRLREQFAARGIVPGAEVGVLHDGDPLLLRIDASRWAIARAEASQIAVTVVRSARRAWWPFGPKRPA